MNSKICEISVGVENFRFTLPKPCASIAAQPISVTLTFAIGGDFFAAANSDCLSDTCDYEAMCHELVHQLRDFDCSRVVEIADFSHHFIRTYSPRIYTGHVSLLVRCHDTFRYAKALL